MSNLLVITQNGLTESANASAGGFLIDIVTFKVGTGATPATVSDTDLESTVYTSNNIPNIQVLDDAAAAEFSLYLENNLTGISTDITITEVGIFLSSGVMFARGLFTTPITKPVGVAIQISALVAATNCDLSVINATVGITTAIPSVPYIKNLADPSESDHNAVAVLDQLYNPLNTVHAGLAIKYGAGGNRWAFSGYDLIYEGYVDSAGYTAIPSIFKLTTLSANNDFANDEIFICQIISGVGEGQSRRMKYKTSTDNFNECDTKSFSPSIVTTGQANASRIVLWRKASGSSGLNSGVQVPALPVNNPDYVLTVHGSDGPKWKAIPGSSSGSGSTNTTDGVPLYNRPSKLKFKVYSWTSDGTDTIYTIPAFSSTSTAEKPPENICYTFVTVQGILQTRQSYELIKREYTIASDNSVLYESVILFSEVPPLGSEIELWYAYREIDTSTSSTSAGARTIAKTFKLGENLIQDGDRKFYLQDTGGTPATDIPDSSDSLFVSIGGIKQFNNTFVYVSNASPGPYIEFNEKPPAGVPIEVTTLLQKTIPGTSEYTKIINNDFYSYDNEIIDIELSEIPTAANAGETVNSYVFVNVSGIYIHRDKYAVIGNRILFSSVINKRRAISVTIIKNVTVSGSNTFNILGIVTEALVSSDYLYLLRHNTLPIKVPLPRPNIRAGDGINILGVYPDLTISVDRTNNSIIQKLPARHSNVYSQEDVEEIVYTYRVVYSSQTVVSVSCDFSARLGPGFMTHHGREYVEYSIGVRSGAGREPAYGRRIKGTGEAGFSYLGKESEYAYANASISDIYEFIPNPNSKGGFVDIVAKMRVLNAAVSEVHSYLSANVNILIHSA